jgi:nitroreductase
MHRDLGPADPLSVGMYLRTSVLALTARGLGTCVEASLAGYPEVLRSELKIPPELSILCGLAVGYSDPDFPANRRTSAARPSRTPSHSSTTDYGRLRLKGFRWPVRHR